MEGHNTQARRNNNKLTNPASEILCSESKHTDVLRNSGTSAGASKLGACENSDDVEIVVNPYVPPVQNGFVVFVHQLNITADSREKRTTIEWISDALKLLDIVPEVATVELMMELTAKSSSCALSKDPPLMMYARLQSDSPFVKSGATGESRRNLVTKPNTNIRSIYQRNNIPIRRKVDSNSLVSSSKNAAPGRKPPQVDSKTFQKKSSPSIGAEVEKQNLKEAGVSIQILRKKLGQIQKANAHTIWVLLIESRKKCIVNMGKLNDLAQTYRFKVRWIGAQAPKSLDQNVFSVVNDIIQTKSICFPEEFKVTCSARHNHLRSKVNAACRASSKQAVSQKIPALEVLHRSTDMKLAKSSHVSLGIEVTNATSKSESFVSFRLQHNFPSLNYKRETQPETVVHSIGKKSYPIPAKTVPPIVGNDSLASAVIPSSEMIRTGVSTILPVATSIRTSRTNPGTRENVRACISGGLGVSATVSTIANVVSDSLVDISLDLESITVHETQPSTTAVKLGSTPLIGNLSQASLNLQQKRNCISD